MELYVSLLDWYQQRALCRCVWEEDGGSCATVVGGIKRHLLCVDNWDCLLLVSLCYYYSELLYYFTSFYCSI